MNVKDMLRRLDELEFGFELQEDGTYRAVIRGKKQVEITEKSNGHLGGTIYENVIYDSGSKALSDIIPSLWDIWPNFNSIRLEFNMMEPNCSRFATVTVWVEIDLNEIDTYKSLGWKTITNYSDGLYAKRCVSVDELKQIMREFIEYCGLDDTPGNIKVRNKELYKEKGNVFIKCEV